MAFEIGTGGGQTATVNEPNRGAFSSNLGGALQFGMAHVVYKILETMGGAIGAFAAGVLVNFMDRIEPSLIKYSRPLIDLMLDLDDLDPKLREFFQQLREPTDAGAAAILGGMATQVSGGVMGSVIGSLMAYPTMAINRATVPALPGVSEAFAMNRRGDMTDAQLDWVLKSLGYRDDFIRGFEGVTKPRAGIGDLLTGLYRKAISPERFMEMMHKYGLGDEDISVFLQNAQALPDIGEIMRGWFRGKLTDEGVTVGLEKLGYKAGDIAFLKSVARPIPSPPDLVRMGLREAFRDDIAAQFTYDEDFPADFGKYMAEHGYAPEWAKYYWRAHWVLPSIGQGFEMMHRGIIESGEMQTLLKISDIPKFWRDRLMQMSYTPLTRVDVRRMHDFGVLDDEAVYWSYRDIGYNDKDAALMRDFTIAYNDKAGEGEMTEYKELTRSVIVSAYQKGIIAQDQAETRLLDIGYEMDGIGLILSLAAWQKDIDDIPDPMPEYRRDLKSMIDKAYSQRIISASEATDTLVGVGFTEIEVAYMLSAVDLWYGLDQSAEMLKTIGDAYITRGINRGDAIAGLGQFGLPSAMSEQKLAEWEVQRHIRSRRATEAQYRKALELEVIGIEEYKENLRGLGYTEYDIWMFTAMVIGVEAAGEPSETGPTTLLER